MIIRLRRKTYSEFTDKLKNSIKMSGIMAAGGAFITAISPLGMISWKIPLVTASLFAVAGAHFGWKNAHIKLKEGEFKDLESIFPVTRTLTEASSLEKNIKDEVNQLLELYEKYNIDDISNYSIPYIYTENSLGLNEYKEFKKTGKVCLFGITMRSIDGIRYYAHTDGQLRRENGSVIRSIVDVKKDLIKVWKSAKKDWFINTFGYGVPESEVEDITKATPEGIKKMKTEIPKAFDVVINKLMRS